MDILEPTAEGDRWVARRYFDRDELFDHPVPDDASPEIELTPADVIAITNSALRKLEADSTAPPRGLDLTDAVRWSFDTILAHLEVVRARRAARSAMEK